MGLTLGGQEGLESGRTASPLVVDHLSFSTDAAWKAAPSGEGVGIYKVVDGLENLFLLSPRSHSLWSHFYLSGCLIKKY